MSLNNPLPGYNLAAEFMGAGTAFITSSNVISSSITRIDFPTVAKSLTIANNDPVFANAINVATTADDLLFNRSFILQGTQQVSLDVKASQLYLRGEGTVTSSYSVAATLSNVPRYYAPAENWSPIMLDPVIWLRADLGVTLATGVSSWADQSGNGYNFVQAAGGNQPEFIANGVNGKPMLRGSRAAPKSLACAKALTLSVGELFFIQYMTTAELASISPVAQNYCFFNGYYAPPYTVYFCPYNAGNKGTRIFTGAAGSTDISAPIVDAPTMLNVSVISPTSAAYQFQNLKGTSPRTGETALSQLTLFSRPSAVDAYTGSISEVLIVRRILTTSERANLFAYFSARYGGSWA
jgi:hypothetical protein